MELSNRNKKNDPQNNYFTLKQNYQTKVFN